LYSNHLEQAREQLTRTPSPLPTMVLNPDVTDLFAFRYEDFPPDGYDPVSSIKALIIAVLLIAGMFVGRTANILLFGPIIIPIFYQFGYSPVHTALIMIIVLGVGHLTPTVGGAILTACLIGKSSMPEVLKYMWPMIILEVVLAVIILLYPPLSTGLPRLLDLGGT